MPEIPAMAVPVPYMRQDGNFVEILLGSFDRRVQIDPCNSAPYKWICELKMDFDAARQQGLGTGFLMNIPGCRNSVILTAGHCFYNPKVGGWCDRVEISFPGIPKVGTITITDVKKLHVTKAYYTAMQNITVDSSGAKIYTDNPDTDCGGIILDRDLGVGGFGYTTTIPDKNLMVFDPTVCGFPGEKSPGTMWVTGGQFQNSSATKVNYQLDTTAGQSGAPVWVWFDGFWSIVGIHNAGQTAWDGSTTNVATRLTCELIREILGWTKYDYFNCSIATTSSAGTTTYLSFESPGRSLVLGSDAVGKIVATANRDDTTMVDIIPLHSYPTGASAPSKSIEWTIASRKWPLTYLQLQGNTVDKFSQGGGGTVLGVSPAPDDLSNTSLQQVFFSDPGITIASDGKLGIKSATFHNVYLRIDGAQVNLQYGNDMNERMKLVSIDEEVTNDAANLNKPPVNNSAESPIADVMPLMFLLGPKTRELTKIPSVSFGALTVSNIESLTRTLRNIK